LPSQINAELDGLNIVLAGLVVSVRELSTKDHRSFCSAMLEDDVGSIEVMVWPRIYENSRDLWQEGNFLRIEGKVKIKEERLQVTCDAVEPCKQDIQPKAVALAVESPKTVKGNHNGKNGNGKNGNIKILNGKSVIVPSGPQYKLTIVIRETEDEEQDEVYLNKLMGILEESRGKDEVSLKIINEERVTNLKLTNIFVDFSPNLQKRLGELVKPENLIIEKLNPVQA
jgi:DNA polymerase III subunit alpha